MATYRFGNGRNITRKYAFKFNFRGFIFSQDFQPNSGNDPTRWEILSVNTGATVKFRSMSGDTLSCYTLPVGGYFGISSELYDPITGNISIPLFYTLKGNVGSGRFELELIKSISLHDYITCFLGFPINSNTLSI